MSKSKRSFSQKINTKLSAFHDRSLIINEKTAFSVREEYKTLRTNILFSIPSEGCKVIGVTSAQPLEGKSINCLNLAITFAEMDARVLLMDCDLRLPSQARLLALDAIPGISNVLVGMNTVEEAIQKTGYSGVDVLLSGDIPPNPAELLGSENMQNLIAELSQKYEYIFIDLPPVNIVTDAIVMSNYLSGMIFIVRAAFSKRDSVIKAIGKLELADANIIGVVLTGVKCKTRFDGRYGRYEDAAYAKRPQKSLKRLRFFHK